MSDALFNPAEAPVPPVPLAEQLREVRREIALRERVYPKWIAEGKVGKRSADEKLRAMRAVADTLVVIMRERKQ